MFAKRRAGMVTKKEEEKLTNRKKGGGKLTNKEKIGSLPTRERERLNKKGAGY
jgi:hypothetical protein